MFRHFISTEPQKRKPTDPPPKDAGVPTPAKQQKTEGEAITEEEQTNWDNIQQIWQGLANQDQATRMVFLEGYIFKEHGPFYDAWANYCSFKSQFSDAFHTLLTDMGDDAGHMRPYLHTLFYDAVTYNSEAFGVTVEYLSGNLPDLSGDRLVLINAMTENNERPGQSSIDMIQYASKEIKNDIDFMCEHVLQYDGEWIGVIDQENLTPDAVDCALRGGEYDRRDILEHIWPVIMNDSHIAREALDWYENLFQSDDFRDRYGNNKHFMISIIAKDYHYCQYAAFLSDGEFVSTVMSLNPNVFQYLQARDRNKESFIEQAVQTDWRNFQYAFEYRRGVLLEDDDRSDDRSEESVQKVGRAMVMHLLNIVPRCGQLVIYTPFRDEEDVMRTAIQNRPKAILSLGLNLRNNPVFLYEMLQRVNDVNYPTVQNSLFANGFGFVAPQIPGERQIPSEIISQLNQAQSIEQFRVRYQIWLENKEIMVAHMVANIMRFRYL